MEVEGSGLRYGDLGTSGAGVLARWSKELELRNHISEEYRNKRVGAEIIGVLHPLKSSSY